MVPPGMVPAGIFTCISLSLMVWLTSDFIVGKKPERARTTSSPAISACRRLICRVGLALQARRRASFRSRVGGASAATPGITVRLQVNSPMSSKCQ
jgi:hypothetical protein